MTTWREFPTVHRAWRAATEEERWQTIFRDEFYLRRRNGGSVTSQEAIQMLLAKGFSAQEYCNRFYEESAKRAYAFSPPSVLWFTETDDGDFDIRWA